MAAGQIGKTTDSSTATTRHDVAGSEPASFRYNNPGAQYPSPEAARFGQIGFGIIGGGHKIACFPSPVNGAASNFDLLYRNYTGMTIGSAGTKWTGAHGFGVPGFDPNSILTKEMVEDSTRAIPLLKAIAGRESGHGSNLTEEQWRQAHKMFKVGSADAYLGALPADGLANVALGTKTGAGLLKRARQHVGEEYRNVQVPKDNTNWKGPWDCAEFVSWLVFQEAGVLHGCLNDNAPPATADAYTGAWKADLENSRLKRVSIQEAAATVGAILLRYPPAPGTMGHIAVSDGKGGTVEAKGRRYGVVEDTAHGRGWDTGVLVPEINYTATAPIDITPPAAIYEPNARNMNKAVVIRIQETLAKKGFNPGVIDGEYGPDTQAAVAAFQSAEGLVVDGAVGPETAEALGVSLTGEDVGAPGQDLTTDTNDMTSVLSILEVLRRILQQPAQDGEASMPAPAATNPISIIEQVARFLQALKQQQPQAETPKTTDPQIDQLRDVIALLLPLINPGAALPTTTAPKTGTALTVTTGATSGTATRTDAPLGPVNGALGQAIGSLLNGKKTSLGIGGALLTSLLSATAGTQTSLGGVLTSLAPAAGLSQFAMPIFLALAAWGALGKFEKWTQGTAPASPGPNK